MVKLQQTCVSRSDRVNNIRVTTVTFSASVLSVMLAVSVPYSVYPNGVKMIIYIYLNVLEHKWVCHETV